MRGEDPANAAQLCLEQPLVAPCPGAESLWEEALGWGSTCTGGWGGGGQEAPSAERKAPGKVRPSRHWRLWD